MVFQPLVGLHWRCLRDTVGPLTVGALLGTRTRHTWHAWLGLDQAQMMRRAGGPQHAQVRAIVLYDVHTSFRLVVSSTVDGLDISLEEPSREFTAVQVHS